MEKNGLVDREEKGHIKFHMKNQGLFVVAFIVLFYGYYGIMCNMLMYNTLGNQIPKSTWEEGFLVIWSFLAYPRTYFLPALLTALVCFLLTYAEEIPYYGIKSSLWFVPITVTFSIFWYWMIFGVSLEPFRLLFGHFNGYLNILILTAINLSSSFAGMKTKQYILEKQSKMK